jgi:hypothetical protein
LIKKFKEIFKKNKIMCSDEILDEIIKTKEGDIDLRSDVSPNKELLSGSIDKDVEDINRIPSNLEHLDKLDLTFKLERHKENNDSY